MVKKKTCLTGEKMGDMFIGDNIILPSTRPKRLQVPKEDIILEPYTKLSDVEDNKSIKCKYLNKKYYTCSHIENKKGLCNSYNCPIKLKKRFRNV